MKKLHLIRKNPLMYLSKEAWLLDGDIFLQGKVIRRDAQFVFVPFDGSSQFTHHIVTKYDLGTTLFTSELHIDDSGLGHLRRIYCEPQRKSGVRKPVQTAGIRASSCGDNLKQEETLLAIEIINFLKEKGRISG